VILFFGGWHLWGLAPHTDANQVTWIGAIIRVAVLSVKVLLTIFFFMWIRWSWPRFRYDQLMDLAWKTMIPLGVVNLFVSAVCQEFLAPGDMLTRCLLGWLAVAGVILYMAMSARPPIGSQARWPGEPGVGTDSKRIRPPGLSVSET
jgi:hypothetical protein